MVSTRAKAQQNPTTVAPFYSAKWTLFAPGLTPSASAEGAFFAFVVLASQDKISA
jgi:hypothetical protein